MTNADWIILSIVFGIVCAGGLIFEVSRRYVEETLESHIGYLELLKEKVQDLQIRVDALAKEAPNYCTRGALEAANNCAGGRMEVHGERIREILSKLEDIDTFKGVTNKDVSDLLKRVESVERFTNRVRNLSGEIATAK